MKYGYDNIRKLAFFGLAFGESLEVASSETGLRRAAAFLSCLDEAVDLIGLDRLALKSEWDDFEDDERAELLAECAEQFNLADKDLEQRIEGSIAAGLQILDGIEKAVLIWKGAAVQ